MKKLFAALVFALALTASADPLVDSFFDWYRWGMAESNAGRLSRVVFYEEAYRKVSALPPANVKPLWLQAFADMLPYARALEAGTINQQQYDDAYRRVDIALTSGITQAQQLDQIQRRQNEAAQMNNTLQIMRMLQPPPPPPPAAPNAGFPISCRSRWVGNQVQTDCN
jgi:hypothetical protein